MQSLLQNYTDPVLSTSNPKDWYVFVRYFHNGKWNPRKFRKGLNRISDYKNRKEAFDVLLKVRHEWLKAGWNPITDPKFKARSVIQPAVMVNMNFNEAMKFALEKKKPDLANKSYADYNNVLDIILDITTETGLGMLPIQMVERPHIMDLLGKLFVKRKISNCRYNFYLVTICAMFSALEKWNIVKYNPGTKITLKPVAESNKFIAYTDKEKIEIANFLAIEHPPLLIVLQTIYHTGIRPKELLLLQIENVDLIRRVITITPDLKEENSKTKTIRQVPIANNLFSLLIAMNLEAYPPNYYVFGTPFKPGEGNRGAGSKDGRIGSMRLDFLTPSQCHARRNSLTMLWKKLIWNELKIHKYLYAGKRTGADDMILAGIDLDSLRNLYGHRSKYMTETYAKAIKEVRNSEIREKAPAFAGAIIRKIA